MTASEQDANLLKNMIETAFKFGHKTLKVIHFGEVEGTNFLIYNLEPFETKTSQFYWKGKRCVRIRLVSIKQQVLYNQILLQYTKKTEDMVNHINSKDESQFYSLTHEGNQETC